jgi:hypothetical protein
LFHVWDERPLLSGKNHSEGKIFLLVHVMRLCTVMVDIGKCSM